LSDETIIKLLPDLAGKAVLDAGCGTGKFCSYAENKGALQILGIDQSPNMIDKARASCQAAKFICSDLAHIPLEKNSFDVIIAALVFGHIENMPPVLEKLLYALKTGGVLIISDFHPFLTLSQSKRTFRNPQSGKISEVRHYLHLYEEYFRCFIKMAAMVEGFEEPRYKETPVVFGIKVKKVG
jgi:malonyl-CoA O-methyltransferase